MGVAIKVDKVSGSQVFVNNELQSKSIINLRNIQLPYTLYDVCAVVYHDEIHILGGTYYGDLKKYHYKYNGKTWENVSVLPISGIKGAFVINDEIHIINSSSYYKWDGNEWSFVADFTFTYSNTAIATVFQNQIHILGAGSSFKEHYKWDGTTWVSVSTLPYEVKNSCAIEYNNQLHLIGGTSQADNRKHYIWDGTTWTKQTNIANYASSARAVVKDGLLYLFVEDITDSTESGYIVYDGTQWTLITRMLIPSYKGFYVVLDDGIYYSGGEYSPNFIFKLGDETLYQGSI